MSPQCLKKCNFYSWGTFDYSPYKVRNSRHTHTFLQGLIEQHCKGFLFNTVALEFMNQHGAHTYTHTHT